MVINLNNMKILDASIHRNEFHIDFSVSVFGRIWNGRRKLHFGEFHFWEWKKWNELTKDRIMSFDFLRNGVSVCKPRWLCTNKVSAVDIQQSQNQSGSTRGNGSSENAIESFDEPFRINPDTRSSIIYLLRKITCSHCVSNKFLRDIIYKQSESETRDQILECMFNHSTPIIVAIISRWICLKFPPNSASLHSKRIRKFIVFPFDK